MVKLTGATIILCSVILLSLIPLWNCKQRIHFLSGIVHDLRFIHNQLHTNLSSVPDLISLLSQTGSPSTKQLYQAVHEEIEKYGAAAFSDNWNICITEQCKYLSEEEKRAFKRLGSILGQYLLEEQLTEINYVMNHFETLLSSEKENLHDKSKLCLGTGTSFGLVLVILLA